MATPHFPLLAECRRPMQKRYVHRNLFIWSPNYYDIHINRFWNLTPKRSPKFQKNNFFFTMCSLNKKIIYVSNKFVAENTWAQYSPTYLDFVNTLKESDKNLKKANIHYYCLLFLDTKKPSCMENKTWLSKWGNIDFNELFGVSLLGRETFRMHRGSNKNILKHDLILSLDIMEYCIETIHTTLPWRFSSITINTTFFQELIITLAMKQQF